MVYFFICSIGALALVLFWNFIWIKTWVDYARDELFDLRDGMRQHFLKCERDIVHDPAYHAVRKLFNQHLRHIKVISIGNFIVTQKILTQKNVQTITDQIVQEVESKMETGDHDLNQYISDIREKASAVLSFYMVMTNPVSAILIAAAYLISVPIVAIMAYMDIVGKGLWSKIIKSIKHTTIERYVLGAPIDNCK